MVVSEAQRDAQRRYYVKNREKCLMAMRERDRERRVQRQNPDDIEAVRGQNRDKYYKSIETRQRAQVKVLLEDEGVCPVFKAFLQTNVVPIIGVKALPIKFITICKNILAIKCAIPSG